MNMKNIAIIPARSGSKGLPDKNIKELCGKPLMAYSIEAALQSGEFDEVIVSTDSIKYAEIAKKWGANVPFLRSVETSSDTASSWAMVDEVLNRYVEQGKEFDTFCLLQPTSPLRTSDDIRAAYDLYRKKAQLAVVSVCEAEHSPLWCGQLPDNNELSNFINHDAMRRRQEIGKFYRLNGAIYIVNAFRFKQEKNLYQAGSYAYIMKQTHSIDIDDEFDYEIASILVNRNLI